MPYTPFHVPPAAVVGWPLRGRPAVALLVRHRHWRNPPEKLALVLVVLAGVGMVVALAAGAV